MPHSIPQDVRWIRRRRHPALQTGGELPRELPLWAFAAGPPRPLRILRRLCYVLAALTFAFPLFYGVVSLQMDGVWEWLPLSEAVGSTLAAALLLAVAVPLRTGWMLAALWVLPLLYGVVLVQFRSSVFIVYLPVTVPMFAAYYACMLQSGFAAWFRRRRSLAKLFGQGH